MPTDTNSQPQRVTLSRIVEEQRETITMLLSRPPREPFSLKLATTAKGEVTIEVEASGQDADEVEAKVHAAFARARAKYPLSPSSQAALEDAGEKPKTIHVHARPKAAKT